MKNLAIIGLLSLALTVVHATVTITPMSGGLQVTGDGEHLKFTVSYPVLHSTDKKKSYGNKGVEVKDNTAVLKYEGGGELDIAIDPSGTITMKGDNLPADVGYVEVRMIISLEFNVGGTFQFDTAAAKLFPENKDKDHLFQNNAQVFVLRAGDGKGIKFTVPQYSYQEITDMRAWGTQSFGWMSQATYSPATALTYKIEDAERAPAAADGSSTNAAPATQ
jgi:hypothetical protein